MEFCFKGQPSGEAFIQMDSETSAFLSAQQKHHRYMTFGKKQRYIEVSWESSYSPFENNILLKTHMVVYVLLRKFENCQIIGLTGRY